MRLKNPTLAFVTAAVAGVILKSVLGSVSVDQVYAPHFENVMGTSLEIRVQSGSETTGRQAEQAILAEIARESRILSGYDPTSEFSQWMRSSAVPVKVSSELLDVLAAFDDWRARTSGALDPATEAITRVWKRAAAENRLPIRPELQAALKDVRQRHWIVDRAARRALAVSV